MEGFDIEVYMQTIKQELLNTFGDELVYLGLQGSFRRGEARESSDIDVMVILEEFTVERMAEYREILKRVGNFNKSCGFICGRKDYCQYHDPAFGAFVPEYFRVAEVTCFGY